MAQRLRTALTAAMVTFLAACGTSGQGSAPAPIPTVAVPDWTMYNGSYAGTRWSTFDQITTQNASKLKVACSLPLGETGAFQAGPVVSDDGVIYVTTMNDTMAIDDTTCALKWKSTYVSTGPVVFNTNRGVALDNATLFRDTQDAHLIALDAATGKTKWNVKVADSSTGAFLSAAPIVWKGKIFVGLAGADWGVRGKMYAFAENDGRMLWSFDLVPTGSEAGATSWTIPASAQRGGGSTWSTYALDPSTGELFIPVGNPAPDFAGGERPGADLYTDGIVVLDADSGKLRWFYQIVPHDTHDYDLGASPMLIGTPDGSRLVVFAGKNGYLYAVDRTSHALKYREPVTTIDDEDAAPTAAGVHVCPGWTGGVEWNGPAYDQNDDSVIVGADDWCGTYTLSSKPTFTPGKFYLGGATAPDPYTTAKGWISAFDASSGKLLWKDKTPGPALSGISPTAGGVTFTGDLAGYFYAIDSKTGKVLYKYQTGGAVAGGVVPYLQGGKEYVVSTSGNVSRSVWPTAISPMKVYVFSL